MTKYYFKVKYFGKIIDEIVVENNTSYQHAYDSALESVKSHVEIEEDIILRGN